MITGRVYPPNRLRRRGWPALAILGTLALSVTAIPGRALDAQAPAQSADLRPRIGLVLGGGGARGFAHVGVLKVLEELRIPVDAIAGTSMGSIVGGLYAQGYTATELEELVLGEDWASMFAPGPDRTGLPLRRKREERELGIDFRFGISTSGVRLPSSLVPDERLNNALSMHTARARGIADFDDLPIPFRAVATDIDSGTAVVLDAGRLERALRASMAVPGVFPPVEVEGRRLVDGGLVQNVPVEVAREMGVDLLIAVDVSTQLADAPRGDDALSLLLRTTTVYSSAATASSLDQLRTEDLVLRPDLSGHPGTDFESAAEIIARGEDVARDSQEALRRFSLDEAEWQRWRREASSALPLPGPVTVAAVVVDTANTALSPRAVRARVDFRASDTLDFDELRSEMDALVGRASLSNAAFSLYPGIDGRDTVVVKARDPDTGPLTVRTGISLYDRQRGFSRWNVRARVGTRRMTRRGGEAWAELELGTRRSVGLWSHLPLTDGDRIFLTGRASVSTEALLLPREALLPLEVALRQRTVQGGVGLRLGSWGEAALEGILARVRVGLDAAPGGVDLSSGGSDRALRLRIDGDVLDRAAFPSSGHLLRGWYRRGDWQGDDAAFLYDQVLVQGLVAVSTGHHTLRLRGQWSDLPRLDDGITTPAHLAWPVGGLDRLAAAAHQEVWGGFSAFASAEWGYRIGAPAADPGMGGLHLSVAIEAGEAALTRGLWRERRRDPLVGGSVRVGRETPVGPITLAWSVLRRGSPVWSVRIGPEF